MEPIVSVIIPSFNRGPFLKKAIESVLAQSYQEFELIVIDDGSEDNTAQIVSSFKRPGNNIVYVRQENKGPAAARNAGITVSRGAFLAFLDSDDWWDNEKLAIQVNRMQKNPSYLISHTEEIWYRNGTLLNQKKRHEKFHGDLFDKCLSLCAVSLSTVMVRRELFERIGLFDEDLPCCEDYDFWLRTSLHFSFFLINKPLTLKDGGRPDQVSSIYATGIDKFRIQSIIKILRKESDLSEEQRALALKELENKCRIYGQGCLKHGRLKEGKYYLGLPGNSFSAEGLSVE